MSDPPVALPLRPERLKTSKEEHPSPREAPDVDHKVYSPEIRGGGRDLTLARQEEREAEFERWSKG